MVNKSIDSMRGTWNTNLGADKWINFWSIKSKERGQLG
jgi:hypothetical protein